MNNLKHDYFINKIVADKVVNKLHSKLLGM